MSAKDRSALPDVQSLTIFIGKNTSLHGEQVDYAYLSGSFSLSFDGQKSEQLVQ